MAEEYEEVVAEGDYEEEAPDGAGGLEDMAAEGTQQEELEAMKRKLAEMQADKERLLAMQGGGTPDDAGPSSAGAAAAAAAAAAAGPSAADIAAKEEVDSRSVYIGNVDYACTPEELQQHFQTCGTVNRVTILTDRSGNPKGYAYLEFLEVDAVANALLLDNSQLAGRQIKVTPKRTNVPGLRVRGRGGRGRGGRGPPGFYPPDPYAYGYYPPPFPPPFAGGGRGRGGYGPPGYPSPGGGRGRGRGRFYSPY